MKSSPTLDKFHRKFPKASAALKQGAANDAPYTKQPPAEKDSPESAAIQARIPASLNVRFFTGLH